jgi:hypothetical protein
MKVALNYNPFSITWFLIILKCTTTLNGILTSKRWKHSHLPGTYFLIDNIFEFPAHGSAVKPYTSSKLTKPST